MPIKKTVYGCKFKCGQRWKPNKSFISEHEKHCFSNIDRVPYDGELTYFKQTGKIVDYGYDDSINMTWYEWNDHDEMPKWWPGEGKIYISGKWFDVKGYECKVIEGAHGCAGGAGCEDIWPANLHKMTTTARLMWWFGYEQPLVGPPEPGGIPF
jgi:hypothetical protein